MPGQSLSICCYRSPPFPGFSSFPGSSQSSPVSCLVYMQKYNGLPLNWWLCLLTLLIGGFSKYHFFNAGVNQVYNKPIASCS